MRSRAITIFAILLTLYIAGFAVFVSNIPDASQPKDALKADGVVVLTGEGARLDAAAEILEKGQAERLLITGVFAKTTKAELKTLAKGGDRFECCADLDFQAADTRGNAREAARWASEHMYKSLIVVTADYHMARSLNEFSATMPDVKLLPAPVAITPASYGRKSFQLVAEYSKYLASLVYCRIERLA